MAHDEDFAHRVREQLANEDAITENSMFGGLAFLLHGNTAVGISSGGELMVRVGSWVARGVDFAGTLPPKG
jgi:TfoX/Sxy family transcriptional regulator of competence genes